MGFYMADNRAQLRSADQQFLMPVTRPGSWPISGTVRTSRVEVESRRVAVGKPYHSSVF